MSGEYCGQPIPVDGSGQIDISGILHKVGDGVFSNIDPTFPFFLNGSTYYSPNGFLFQVGASPPPEFFDIHGIYAQRFLPPVKSTFDRLYAQQQLLNPLLPDPFNNQRQLNPVQRMSISQRQKYTRQLELFRKVYAYNLVAYTEAGRKGLVPIYYRFALASELTLFRDAAALVNKLYSVSTPYPLTSIFFLPFPPFCN